MAESLPRYQKAGVLLADVPRLDFGDRREQARSLSSLDERLGQLSQWALGEAVDRAKVEGLQFGADNPVTISQLEAAEGPKLQPRGTVFGDAARSIQVMGIAADVELDGQETINRLKIAAKRGEIDTTGVAVELKALVEGAGKSLVKIDPKASHKVRGALATAANSAYLSILESNAKKVDEQTRVQIDDWISNVVPEQVRSALEAGDTIDPETGRVVTPRQRIVASLHGPLREKLRGQTDEFARQADKRFADIVARERVNALSAHALENNLSLGQIRGGQFGKYAGTWREMQADDQEKVVVNYMQESGRRHLLEERTRKQGEEAQKRDVYGMLSDYWTMRDGPKKDALKRDIVAKGQGVLSFDQLKSLLKPPTDGGEGKADVTLEIQAENAVRRGGITDLAEVQRRFPGLRPAQLKHLNGVINNSGDRTLNDGIRLLAGIPDGLVQMSGDQQRRKLALQTEAERLKLEEIEKNGKAGAPGMWSPSSVLAKLRDAKDRITADKEVEGARATLESFGQSKKATITENTSEQELKRLKFSPAEINEIKRRQRLLRGER